MWIYSIVYASWSYVVESVGNANGYHVEFAAEMTMAFPRSDANCPVERQNAVSGETRWRRGPRDTYVMRVGVRSTAEKERKARETKRKAKKRKEKKRKPKQCK